MVPISIPSYVEKHIKNNPDTNRKKFTELLQSNLKRKQEGTGCIQCGQAIWVIGSSACEWDGCFTCITGEADSTGDYEVEDGI